eukprot:GGOE01026250.1.p2 GENE.GGOE01026250.1~~GGOE01026250.1.p2  ORF type:complete len:121 (-),score=2.48 GGOE01026250.1:290-652(-)
MYYQCPEHGTTPCIFHDDRPHAAVPPPRPARYTTCMLAHSTHSSGSWMGGFAAGRLFISKSTVAEAQGSPVNRGFWHIIVSFYMSLLLDGFRRMLLGQTLFVLPFPHAPRGDRGENVCQI